MNSPYVPLPAIFEFALASTVACGGATAISAGDAGRAPQGRHGALEMSCRALATWSSLDLAARSPPNALHAKARRPGADGGRDGRRVPPPLPKARRDDRDDGVRQRRRAAPRVPERR